MRIIKNDFIVVISLVGVIIIWGVNFPIMKFAFFQITPMAFNVIRFSFASVALLIILLLQEGWQKLPKKDWCLLAVQGFFHTFFYQILFINGLFKTPSGIASILTSTSPLWTALFAWLFKVEKINKWIITGVFTTFIGVLLIVIGSRNGLTFGDELKGEILVLFSALSWASGTLVSKKLLEKYTPLRITALSMILGSLGLISSGLYMTLQQDWASVNRLTWEATAFSAIFSIFLGYLVWAWAIKKIGATKTSTFGNLTPAVAFISAYFITGESVSFIQIIGSIIVIIGIHIIILLRVNDLSSLKN